LIGGGNSVEKEDVTGVMIKFLTNYTQIISALNSFTLPIPKGFDDVADFASSPLTKLQFSLDCSLVNSAKNADMPLIYFRIIFGHIYPAFFIILYNLLYIMVTSAFKIVRPDIGLITTAMIYIFLYFQPNMVSNLVDLLSCRSIGES
jgi:hypothetical protein